MHDAVWYSETSLYSYIHYVHLETYCTGQSTVMSEVKFTVAS